LIAPATGALCFGQCLGDPLGFPYFIPWKTSAELKGSRPATRLAGTGAVALDRLPGPIYNTKKSGVE